MELFLFFQNSFEYCPFAIAQIDYSSKAIQRISSQKYIFFRDTHYQALKEIAPFRCKIYDFSRIKKPNKITIISSQKLVIGVHFLLKVE